MDRQDGQDFFEAAEDDFPGTENLARQTINILLILSIHVISQVRAGAVGTGEMTAAYAGIFPGPFSLGRP